jgi:predicted nucleotidyltransferase
MGNNMNDVNPLHDIQRQEPDNIVSTSSLRRDAPLIPWLDPESAASVRDIVQSVATHHPEVQAVILFGSVARHEERSLDDPEPSDVDLLLIIDPAVLDPGAERLSNTQDLALTRTIGGADYRHRAPREINTFFANRLLTGWDSLFIENVARDGILLWARGPLPKALAPIEQRGILSALTAQHP